MSIDSAARVGPKAHLGSNVSIGPFTIVEDGAVIGDGTTIAANALIGRGARIGKDCRIHHGAVVGHEPQDLKYAGEETTCELGDRTVIREYATLHRGTVDAGGKTVVGSDCFIMGYVHIAHDCRVGNKVIMSNAAMLAGHCVVEDNATLGGILAVHQFVRMGRHCMVGGGVRVARDVPPFAMASHAPAVFVGLNYVGLKRRGFSQETIASIDKAYQVIYFSKLNLRQAMEQLKGTATLMACPEVQQIVTFIEGSKRGMVARTRLREE